MTPEFVDTKEHATMKNGIVIIDKRDEGLDVLAEGRISERPSHKMREESVFYSHQIGRPSIHDPLDLIRRKIAGANERLRNGIFSQESQG